jgi:peptidoglycan/xylan/chitin deacetylase (PgdA/CDA1 family)
LKLLKQYGVTSSWYIPGHTIATYPDQCARVAEAGYEIGHHGWTHRPPATLSREEEEEELVRANEAIRKLTGRAARGYRSPSWDLSPHSVDLLLAHGFVYDSSLMGGDYLPYRARRGDVAELGKPYRFGEETRLIEMPISWSLDDHPHFEFIRTPTAILPGLQSARAVMQNWLDEFLYMKKSVDWGVLTYTMHPYVIGRGYRMLAFEDLVAKLTAEGAVFMTMEDAAAEGRERLGLGTGCE